LPTPTIKITPTGDVEPSVWNHDEHDLGDGTQSLTEKATRLVGRAVCTGERVGSSSKTASRMKARFESGRQPECLAGRASGLTEAVMSGT
jgi:hypothetical protein